MNEQFDLKNRVSLEFYIYGNIVSPDVVALWFRKMVYFNIDRMSGRTSTKYRSIKYRENRFFNEMITQEINSHTNFSLELQNDNLLNCEVILHDQHIIFRSTMMHETFLLHQSKIISDFESIYQKANGCMGYLYNAFDQMHIQNPSDVSIYEKYGLPTDNLKLIPNHKGSYFPLAIDKEQLPGHEEHYGGYLLFTSCYTMWFGPDYYEFIPRDSVESFSNCLENVEFADGFRRIRLYENVMEYDKPEHRERQWAFRKHVHLDEITHQLANKPLPPKEGSIPTDSEIEYFTGNFEHGGTLLARYYVDKKGKSVPESKAYASITLEFANNVVVWKDKQIISK